MKKKITHRSNNYPCKKDNDNLAKLVKKNPEECSLKCASVKKTVGKIIEKGNTMISTSQQMIVIIGL